MIGEGFGLYYITFKTEKSKKGGIANQSIKSRKIKFLGDLLAYYFDLFFYMINTFSIIL